MPRISRVGTVCASAATFIVPSVYEGAGGESLVVIEDLMECLAFHAAPTGQVVAGRASAHRSA